MKKIKNKFLLAIVTPIMIIASIFFAIPGVAHADATGVSFWGAGVIKGVTIYRGWYQATLVGQKRYVQLVDGYFASVGNVCNWNITAELFNNNGQWIKTVNGAYHGGCSLTGRDVVHVNYQMSTDGFMCSTLKTNGARITSVCHNIHN